MFYGYYSSDVLFCPVASTETHSFPPAEHNLRICEQPVEYSKHLFHHDVGLN